MSKVCKKLILFCSLAINRPLRNQITICVDELSQLRGDSPLMANKMHFLLTARPSELGGKSHEKWLTTLELFLFASMADKLVVAVSLKEF